MGSRSFSKVEELYHAARARPAAEREGFLSRACGGDEALLREVKSLLGYEEEAKRLLEEPVGEAATRRLAIVRGRRLGPYEVGDLIGAGGMGEVYRAHDTRLGRDVAVKVLPEHVAQDPEALARFSREARAVASLSHPHIAALFDIGEHDGTHYLVMELLEGETLAERVRRGALAEADVVRIGAEIAEALGAAHRRGVVHRDVKPANVVLTRSGSKLLDFGLARLPRALGPEGATATTGLGEGVVAGTLPYMAPEQLEGQAADARADVWALGCVLFEMLVRERAFEGDTPARLIAAIEKDEAPSALSRRPGTSAALDRLVRQCLKKDPAERWQSAHDVALRLREIAQTGRGAETHAEVLSPWWRLVPIVVAVGALALLVGVIVGRQWQRPPAHHAPVVRSHIALPMGTQLTGLSGTNFPNVTQLALSPDGRQLAWSGSTPGSGNEAAALYVRSLERGETRRIPGTEGAVAPFFSPDGRWIAFFSKPRLRKVSVEGGFVVDLGEGHSYGGSSWTPDGRIFVGSRSPWGAGREVERDLLGVRWIPAEGGSYTKVTSVDPEREVVHRLPRLLPDRRTLLVTMLPHTDGPKARVEAVSLESGAGKSLIDECADARYLSTGHVVCMRRGVLMAASFVLSRLELQDALVPVVKGISHAVNSDESTGAGQYAVSEGGLLVYAAGGIFPDPPLEAVLIDGTGQIEPLPGFDRPLASAQFRFSPDGRRIAFVERAITGRLWLFDVERQTHRALSREGIAAAPLWSPDGTRVIVGWSKAGPYNLWSVPVEGGGEWERLSQSDAMELPSSLSPDGQVLAYVREGNVFLYRFADRQVTPFVATSAHEECPQFSPDGRWLAYTSNESGRREIYVTSFPDRRQTYTVSHEGGAESAWSRDGRRLFYRSLDDKSLLVVRVRPGPSVSLGKPAVLCHTPSYLNRMWQFRGYDPHPDGRRFLFGRIKEERPPPITRLELVHNWFAELERLSPTGR